MILSLSAAAKQVGKSKTTLTRAIKSGRLSAQRHEDGSYSIDPAELSRVYPARLVASPKNGEVRDPIDTPDNGEVAQLRMKVEMLEVMLVREQDTVADLRTRLDRAESRVTALLPASSDKPHRRWWPW